MVIRSAEFIKSSPSLNECPESTLPEYAFIGRSNVGKSSLINTITGFSKLAKISSSPGKTQLINHFLINEAWYLTDLPGFGFAKVPVRIKRKWDLMIRNYLLKRPNLVMTTWCASASPSCTAFSICVCMRASAAGTAATQGCPRPMRRHILPDFWNFPCKTT